MRNQEGRRRVGIMGGTFDPIHIGHLMLAERAYEQFELDTVLFLPAGNPPHKHGRTGGAEDEDRVAMVALAIRDNPHFSLDAEEMRRSGDTYTFETLLALREAHPDTDYYFIIGADSLFALGTWKNPQIVCRNCTLLAAVRDHASRERMEREIERLRRRYGADIRLLDTPDMEISSTELRDRARRGQSLRYYVPDAVRDYITKFDVYQDSTTDEDNEAK